MAGHCILGHINPPYIMHAKINITIKKNIKKLNAAVMEIERPDKQFKETFVSFVCYIVHHFILPQITQACCPI